MAVSDAYATVAQYRSVIGKDDTSQDSAILADLTAISRFLEGKLQRFFNADAADVSRVYVVPETQPTLRVDDLSAVPTSIIVDRDADGDFDDDTALTSSDYELLPLNAALGPEPRPYTKIGLTSWGDYSMFHAGQRVQVTGKFGWPAVPVAIQRACIHLTAILRLESPRATVRVPEQGLLSVGEQLEVSPDAQRIIRQLTDRYWRPGYV